MNYLSPMELLTLLAKTKHSVSDLSPTEFKFLSYLLVRVNGNKIPTHGYLAWPAIDNIMEYTGLGDTTIQKVRKTLVTKGYMEIVSGHGPNSSNHYYINAQKIVDGAMSSGENRSAKIVAPTQIEPKEKGKKKHVRNTDNLVQNKDKPKDYVKPVNKPVDKPTQASIMDEQDDDPFSSYVAPKEQPKKVPEKNSDGSPMYWSNGTRRYFWTDTMQSLEDDPDCPF